jgi:hypothetical protein
MTGYYDIVLGLIPLALAGISGALTFAGLRVTIAVTIGALVAVLFMGHAMFVRSPTVQTPSSDQTPSRADVSPINVD